MTQQITIHMSDDMIAALKIIATNEHATFGELVRDAVRRDLHNRSRRAVAQKINAHLHGADDTTARLAG